MKKVLFITPYPHDSAPSQRFRFEQYFRYLKEHQIEYKQVSFLDQKTWSVLYKSGHSIQKVWGIVKGFAHRKLLLLSVPKYNIVFIHREASPIGPPVFEWIITKVLRKKVIYDFDDSIWLPNTSKVNRIVSLVKWHKKVGSICKWVTKVSCGNQYLADFAGQFNDNVEVIPTTIDTERVHNQTKLFDASKKVVLGWTGTHSTSFYLNDLVPVLQRLEKKFDFEFHVISNRKPDFQLDSMKFIEWKKDSEVTDLMNFDLGLMPLKDNEWARGKCGFKALQYMSLGIPAAVSPVGVNTKIVQNRENGFICKDDEWEKNLTEVLEGNANLGQLGEKAQQFIKDNYSVYAQRNNFLQLFD